MLAGGGVLPVRVDGKCVASLALDSHLKRCSYRCLLLRFSFLVSRFWPGTVPPWHTRCPLSSIRMLWPLLWSSLAASSCPSVHAGDVVRIFLIRRCLS